MTETVEPNSEQKAIIISPENVEIRDRDGFSYRPLIQTSEGKGFNVNLVDVYGRHYRTKIQGGVTRSYYVTEGRGTFTLDGNKYKVEKGDLVIVPDGHEYEYEGSMHLLETNVPGATKENEVNLDGR